MRKRSRFGVGCPYCWCGRLAMPQFHKASVPRLFLYKNIIMKSVLATLFILFFITFSTIAFAQSFKIDSVTKGSDFNEYSHSSRDYFEGLINSISEFTIDISEGDLAIVSMEKSDWKLMFRFYRSANMLKMPQEEYRKTNEFYCTSDIINGINYLEMSVERVSGEISSGEISFYPEKGLYKYIFTVNFSPKNNENYSSNEIKKKEELLKEKNDYSQSNAVSSDNRVYSVEYSLPNRTARPIFKPDCSLDKSGVIVVQITVDKNGNVTEALPGIKGTTISNEECWEEAKNISLKAKFNKDEDAPAFQQGTISYKFILD